MLSNNVFGALYLSRHQQPMYWICRTQVSLTFTRSFNRLRHFSVENYIYIMQIYIKVSWHIFSTTRLVHATTSHRLHPYKSARVVLEQAVVHTWHVSTHLAKTQLPSVPVTKAPLDICPWKTTFSTKTHCYVTCQSNANTFWDLHPKRYLFWNIICNS